MNTWAPASLNLKRTPRICVFVLGAHRSGASALARVLSLLGAALPKNLPFMGPPGNETGHWEPERLIKYPDQLMAECGSTWQDWRRLPFRVADQHRSNAQRRLHASR